MEPKLNVIPSDEKISEMKESKNKIENFEKEKKEVVKQIFSGVKVTDNMEGETYNYLAQNDGIEAMKRRTEEQLLKRDKGEMVVEPSLAEPTTRKIYENSTNDNNNYLMSLRDEALAKNREQTQNYQRLSDEAMNRHKPIPNNNMSESNGSYNPSTPVKPPVTNDVVYEASPSDFNQYIFELSQPNYNAPFDVIPLPSQGKTYKSKKENVRLSYMTTADENILTSPNLLESGEFLSILINRKLLQPDLRYKDLLVGDRNAIMIWLRATGYGEMYPVTLLDENGEPFDTEVNLNNLKTKNLGAEPDYEGLFDYKFKLSDAEIKFKLLTCGDIDYIEKLTEQDKLNELPIDNSSTYMLEKMIVEVNGFREKNMIKDFISSIRIQDGKAFNEYVEAIQCGIDLNITVGTPGGSSIDTFLPLNIGFFWPNFRL